MSSTRHNASATSSERKRLRDRRAQQNLREKRENRMRALEERVAYCDKNHGNELIRNCMHTVDCVRRENELLHARQEHLRRLFQDWEVQGNGATGVYRTLSSTSMTTNSFSAPWALTTSAGSPRSDITLVDPGMQNLSGWSVNGTDSAGLGLTTDGLTAPSMTSTWPVALDTRSSPSPIIDIPLMSSMHPTPGPDTYPLMTHKDYTQMAANSGNWSGWSALSDTVHKLPLLPSPFDLLHGSRRNWLADQINRLLRRLSLREPDRLALSWTMYSFARWRANPTPLTFANMPSFLQPVAGQVRQHQHPEFVFFLWPQLRVNYLESRSAIDLIEVYRYGISSCRVRWPSSVSIWDWDDDENMFVKPEFFETFLDRSGWGLTSVFIDKYPELVKGMDVESLRYDVP
ncbi:hypothetical protein ANOM_001324 [Aspergillus nomiae NRRL 13137]|uniref:BZIP domain-containing protein n=1 Tax=Aspergillus nomiae NRRL (strain ATCC 15546 / NRRL 13137 / CBS 260.88 / M93) TaxID=1509407 RepID=A0A0L1JFP7_ASPN3|nr:uncharacterized protein ANOM_001324 [Aspergillus nomiae NRRL 13137]KNG90614.1 hypothetical protein ANOM_001324 [Aspergillus nomiae NRRL 13137]